MITQRTSTNSITPDRLGLPPPPALDLFDADRRVGWVRGDAIGFRGFGSEVEAAHAAWVAHRAIARRLAQRRGLRPIPVDAERLALDRRDDVTLVLASGRPIATVQPPALDGPGGDDSHAFELRVPGPLDELTMRSLAYLAYRTLRRSGVRWAMWARDGRRAAPEAVAAPATRPAAAAERAPGGSARGIDWGLAFLGLVAILVLALVVPSTAAAMIVVAGLGAFTLAGILDVPRGWWERRARRPVRPRTEVASPASATSAAPGPGAGRRPRVRRRASMAAAVTIASLAALLLAFAAPARAALVLSGAGLIGLLAVRLFAMPAGWPPRRPVRPRPHPVVDALAGISDALEREAADHEPRRDAARLARHDADDVPRDAAEHDGASVSVVA